MAGGLKKKLNKLIATKEKPAGYSAFRIRHCGDARRVGWAAEAGVLKFESNDKSSRS